MIIKAIFVLVFLMFLSQANFAQDDLPRRIGPWRIYRYSSTVVYEMPGCKIEIDNEIHGLSVDSKKDYNPGIANSYITEMVVYEIKDKPRMVYQQSWYNMPETTLEGYRTFTRHLYFVTQKKGKPIKFLFDKFKKEIEMLPKEVQEMIVQ